MVSDGKNVQKIPLRAYFSAAVLAATPAYIMTYLLVTFIPENVVLYLAFIVPSSFLGGLGGCYLLRKRYEEANQYISTLKPK